jgi:hypothetical protein
MIDSTPQALDFGLTQQLEYSRGPVLSYRPPEYWVLRSDG